MTILGIDPGTASTGYGLIKSSRLGMKLLDFGWISTDKTRDPGTRLNDIYLKMLSLLRNKNPDTIAIEKLFFYSNAKTVIGVSQAHGVILLAAKRSKVPVFEFSPLEIKRVVTGNGWAKKDEIKKTVRNMLKFRIPPKKKTHFDDVTDAIACALCYIKKGGEEKWQTLK